MSRAVKQRLDRLATAAGLGRRHRYDAVVLWLMAGGREYPGAVQVNEWFWALLIVIGPDRRGRRVVISRREDARDPVAYDQAVAERVTTLAADPYCRPPSPEAQAEWRRQWDHPPGVVTGAVRVQLGDPEVRDPETPRVLVTVPRCERCGTATSQN